MPYMNNPSLNALGATDGSGDFSSISLLTCFSFPELQLLETNSLEGIQSNRIFLHEYQHFMQTTSTSFGFNLLHWELERGIFTSFCVKKVLEHLPKLELPLLSLYDRTKNLKVKEIINSNYKSIKRTEERIGVLFGDCEYDINSDSIKYMNKDLISIYNTTPFVNYESYNPPIQVPLGARAIMEGAASLLEAVYLNYKALNNSEFAIKELEKWRNYEEPDHTYHAIIDYAQGLDFYTILALADLSLFTPFEYGSYIADRYERSPGFRFIKCVEEARNLPQLKITNFHSNYKKFIEEICHRLNWNTPWEMITDEILDYIADELPDYPIGTHGLRTTLLKGFELRRKLPAYCALPFLNIYDKSAVEELVKKSGKKRAILDLNFIQHLHAPPFVMAGSTRAKNIERISTIDEFTEFYNNPEKYPEFMEELKKHPNILTSIKENPLTKEGYIKGLKSSYEKYYIGHNLINLIWYGPRKKNSEICLKLNGKARPKCKGGITSGDYGNAEECLCKEVFLDFIPPGFHNIKWTIA